MDELTSFFICQYITGDTAQSCESPLAIHFTPFKGIAHNLPDKCLNAFLSSEEIHASGIAPRPEEHHCV